MAELASGAVSSFLGVIRNEARLLDGVKGDVQFIKEEMESTNSFLLHLARTAPPGREHDEQVRTWMNQVRLLAQDCNNCIDLYLYRGNPDIHLPKDGLWRYLLWTPWFLRKMAAQHHAAIQLRELKDRARDVGKRRLRYGVEVPSRAAVAGQSSSQMPPAAGAGAVLTAVPPYLPSSQLLAAAGEHNDQDGDDQVLAAAASDPARKALLEPRTLDEYVEGKLVKWIKQHKTTSGSIPSVAIVAPDTEDTAAIAREALAVAETHFKLKVILVDIPAVHLDFPLFWFFHQGVVAQDILYYILRELEQPAKAGQGEGKEQIIDRKGKKNIASDKRKVIDEITGKIKEMKLDDKINEIKNRIRQMKDRQLQLGLEQMEADEPGGRSSIEPLGVLLLALRLLQSDDQDQGSEKAMSTLASDDMKKTARKLKEYMEEIMVVEIEEHWEDQVVKRPPPIHLQDTQYECILQEELPTRKSQQQQAAKDQGTTMQATRTTTNSSTTLGEDQMKEIVHRVLQELQQGKYVNKLAIGSSNPGQDQIPDDAAVKETITAPFEETMEKVNKILRKIKFQLTINGMVDKIRNHLTQERTLIILKCDKEHISEWEKTRNALSMLRCVDSAVIVTTTTSTQQAKKYCYPSSQEPIYYSLVGLYHDIVLELTTQQKNEDSNYSPQTFRNILDECKPHEFCMKIFTHALYVNPKRSNEELTKLHKTLLALSPKSLDNIANKMIKFSYNVLPKEYKSCLLYLAIFPPERKIRRSTLVGRWVAEGLVTTEDWSWSSSVHKTEQCFDTLINLWLVYPADTGATGEVKSCMVGDLVHEFITKIAKKQRILEARLSHHLAGHFSIFNDLRLRGSDTIHNFLQKLSLSPQFSLLKVLDLEGCHCFGGKNKRYLKDICCKVLLLKYLSLRRTDVTQLPNEINNLHELEVLDIRQTMVPASATRHVRLLKLKRLLAGHTDPSPSSTDTGTTVRTEEVYGSARIPEKIENMIDMEVLSRVKPWNHQDLKDIGALCQLKKLGVVIEEKDTHLSCLLEVISNLHESLRSLSITLLPITRSKGTTSTGCLFLQNAISRGSPAGATGSSLKDPPKFLQTLSISGTTQKLQLLRILLARDVNELAKVTLSSTSLNQGHLDVLAKLPKLHCLRLQHILCTKGKLTFNKDKFLYLKYFLFEGSTMTDISFQAGATPGLEEIVLSFTIDGLPNLEEHKSNNNTTTAPTTTTRVDDHPKLEEIELNNNTAAAAAAAAATTTGVKDLPKLEERGLATTTTSSHSSSSNMLLSFFDNNAKQIAKVTLRGTLLKQGDLQILAKNANMRCLALVDKSYVDGQLTFSKNEFPKLNLLIVKCSNITKISFASAGSTPKLTKIVWSFTKIESLSGIENLPRLKELEFNGDFVPDEVKEAIKLKNIKTYMNLNIYNKPENQDQATEVEPEEDDGVASFPFCWKNKV